MAPGMLVNAELGSSTAISADGSTLAVGALNDNNQTGAAWIYVRNGAAWVPQSGKLLTGTAYTGTGIGLSADGNTMVVGNPNGAWVYTPPSPTSYRLALTGIHRIRGMWYPSQTHQPQPLKAMYGSFTMQG